MLKPELETEGILEPTYEFLNGHNLILARTLTNTENAEVIIRLLNVTTEVERVHQGTVIAELTPVIEVRTVERHEVDLGDRIESEDGATSSKSLPAYMEDLWSRCATNLDEDQKKRVKHLLLEHIEIFAKSKEDTGLTDLVEHRIETGDATPIKQRPRRLPIQQRQEEKQQIEEMLKRGIITESQSPWASPVVLVRKKDNTWRYCIDYRRLNGVCIKDSYPLPRIDDSLDRLSGAVWFSTLDLQSGYWQVKMAPEDQQKTAFTTSQGLFEFLVMPFGLANAPATFERLMERILKGLQWNTCLVYLDDVIVYAGEFDQALGRLDEVFRRLGSAGLKLNPQKCNLFQEEVSYLGHVVSKEGVGTDPEKTRAIESWPEPKNVSQLRSFLGTCSYYRRFIGGYANIAKPLHILTEKNRVFSWNEDAQEAFEKLKTALVTSPILAYPDPESMFILDTDASDHGIGSVLSQIQEGKERVIAYFSRTLNKPERRYCVTRKELLAVVVSVKNFHHYLFGKRFLIRTDHGALRWLMRFKNPEGQTARWLEVLGTYDFEIQHRLGRYHGNCDGLSRRPCEDQDCNQCARIQRYDEEIPVHVPRRLPKEEPSSSGRESTTKEPRFQEGDLVWYYWVVKKKGVSPKLQNHWQGPYRIIKKFSDILFKIRRKGSQTTVTVHSDKLRKCYQNDHNERSREEVGEKIESSSETKDDVTPSRTMCGREIKRPQWYGIPN